MPAAALSLAGEGGTLAMAGMSIATRSVSVPISAPGASAAEPLFSPASRLAKRTGAAAAVALMHREFRNGPRGGCSPSTRGSVARINCRFAGQISSGGLPLASCSVALSTASALASATIASTTSTASSGAIPAGISPSSRGGVTSWPPVLSTGPSPAFFARRRGGFPPLKTCSASHVVHRVCLIESFTMATMAWLVTRRSRGQ